MCTQKKGEVYGELLCAQLLPITTSAPTLPAPNQYRKAYRKDYPRGSRRLASEAAVPADDNNIHLILQSALSLSLQAN